jgi:sporulation protein YlmC with PRC-barrel domain
MTANKITLVGALILSAVFFVSTAFAEDLSYHPMGPASRAASLIGAEVNSEAGNYIGNISNFIIDEANGRVSLVVLTGVPGFGSDQLSFPYECLRRSAGQTFMMRFYGEAPAVNGARDPVLHALKQYPADSPFFAIPNPITSSWVAEVYRSYGYVPYWVRSGKKVPAAGQLIKATKLLGAQVATAEGNAHGTINDLIMNSSGRLDLLVLSNVPGRGDSKVVVPFEALAKSSEGALVLNVTAERLAMAPVFHEPYAKRTGYDERVDRFFGLAPSWTVEHHAASNPYKWGGAAQDF